MAEHKQEIDNIERIDHVDHGTARLVDKKPMAANYCETTNESKM